MIDELRDRGRTVGIVSHVSELKHRIAERIEVRRLPDGSSTLRVVAWPDARMPSESARIRRCGSRASDQPAAAIAASSGSASSAPADQQVGQVRVLAVVDQRRAVDAEACSPAASTTPTGAAESHSHWPPACR